jgi:hypothetical protein
MDRALQIGELFDHLPVKTLRKLKPLAMRTRDSVAILHQSVLDEPLFLAANTLRRSPRIEFVFAATIKLRDQHCRDQDYHRKRHGIGHDSSKACEPALQISIGIGLETTFKKLNAQDFHHPSAYGHKTVECSLASIG